MSWIIRTAAHKANLFRIRTYADSVVNNAVSGGAKLFHGYMGNGYYQSFHESVKRLEELAVSSKGEERVLMLRRWLDSLRAAITYKNADAEKRNEETEESTQPTLELYQDVDHGGEPLTFLEVILRSEALEGIVLSMILEAPNDEEVALLLEIFGYCLMGGKEVHNAILRNIVDLAKGFSCHPNEALIRRDELLQIAHSSISGLKINSNQTRIDVEVTSLKNELKKEIKIPEENHDDKSSEELEDMRAQAIKEALSHVRLYSKLSTLLFQKKDLNYGDTPEAHAQKIDKFNNILQSLANSSSKVKKEIEEHRRKKEDELTSHVAKENEVCRAEKDLQAEIEKLQQQKDALEAQMKEVSGSLASANERLQSTRKERQHLVEANKELLRHFETKEQELLKSIALCKTEADIGSSCVNFIESTWRLHSDVKKQKQEIVNAELEQFAENFVNLSKLLLPAYKNELSSSVKNFEDYAQKLQNVSNDSDVNPWNNKAHNAPDNNMRNLEEEYQDMEAKIISAFSVVESIKQLLAQSKPFYRKDDCQNIQKLLDDLRMVIDEFESVERPDLSVETPTTLRWKKISKKLAFKEGIEEPELPRSRFMPHEDEEEENEEEDEEEDKEEDDEENEKQPQQEEEKLKFNKRKSRKQHRRVVTVDGQELVVSDNMPYKPNQHVIDGEEILDSDDELTNFDSEFNASITSRATRDLNEWEV